MDTVRAQQREWRRQRRRLNRSRRELAMSAAGLYRPDARVGGAPFLAPGEWMPSAPVRLEDISLEWLPEPEPPRVTGTEPEAERILPLRAPGRRFDRYTAAIRCLDKPALFENRLSYRLLSADLSAGTRRLGFGSGNYFDKLDLGEGIAHELAAASEEPGREVTWSDLPMRSLVGDPFELGRRAVLPAIETLTLRRDRRSGNASFPLHWRDPAKVATAAGIYGLIPAGEFQPSGINARVGEGDFDLWRNMVREYSEELLGEPERDGTQNEPVDYERWDLYRRMRHGRERGGIQAYCLGLGVDALTLTATILTVVVFDDEVFDGLFGSAVRINAEGVLVSAAEATSVSEGVPFDERCVRRLLDKEPMASPGACLLDRAWRFRGELLGGAGPAT